MTKVEVDPTIFEDLSTQEIKDSIVRNVRRIKELKAELKDVRTSINDTIKELEARNEAALDQLDKDKAATPGGVLNLNNTVPLSS